MFNLDAKASRRPGPAAAGSPPQRLPAWRWLFPLATLHAAVMIPLSLLALYHGGRLVGHLGSPAAHAREMLFGFALAVIAGYLLGPQPRRRLTILVGLWLVGRLGVLDVPGSAVASLADAAFALWVATLLVPRFLAAKKWRNRVLAPLLGLICLLAVVTLTWRYLDGMPTTTPLMHQSVLWLVLLMVFMGGRIVAPAVNGHFLHRYRRAGAGVQPRLEAALIVLLGLAPFVMLWPAFHPLAALMVAAAGVLVLLRISRWEPLRCAGRPDLQVLMLGYAWLGIGLLLLARHWWLPTHASATLHIFTIAALGTLSSTIMVRHVILRAKQRPESEPLLLPLAGLFATAALLRLWALDMGDYWQVVLWSSALCWSLAWCLVCWRLCALIRRLPRREPGKLDPGQ